MTKKYNKPIRPWEVVPGPVTIPGYAWKGVSAHFLDEETGNAVVLTSPDMKQLKAMWKLISDGEPLKEPLTKSTVGQYVEPPEEDSVPWKEDKEEYWLLHDPSDEIVIGCLDDLTNPDLRRIGKVEKKSIQACKILLRSKGWTRDEIESVTITM